MWDAFGDGWGSVSLLLISETYGSENLRPSCGNNPARLSRCFHPNSQDMDSYVLKIVGYSVEYPWEVHLVVDIFTILIIVCVLVVTKRSYCAFIYV